MVTAQTRKCAETARGMIPAMQNGWILYHALTLDKRLPELEKHATNGMIHSKPGKLLETMFDDRMGITVKHWLTDNGELWRSIEPYPDRRRGVGSSEFLGYNRRVWPSDRNAYSPFRPPCFITMPVLDDGQYIHGQPKSFGEFHSTRFRDVKGFLDLVERVVSSRGTPAQDGYQTEIEVYNGIFARLAAYLVGFADAALRNKDVETAKRTYQIAGVQDTKHVKRKLEVAGKMRAV